MSPATKTRPTKAKAAKQVEADDRDDLELLDMEQIEEKRIRDDYQQYREAVKQAADGYRHDGAELGRINGVMASLEIPSHCWQRDIEAFRKMRDFGAEADKLMARQPERDIEVQQVRAEIVQLERRLGECNSRLHVLTKVEPATMVGYGQRQGELQLNHPHLFAPLGGQVARRVAAMRAKSSTPAGRRL